MAVWTILKMTTLPDFQGSIDFVWGVVWQCTVTVGGVSASIVGNVTLDPESPGVTYTPYEDLTEDQVVAWVKETLGATVVTKTETVLTAQAQSVVLPLPW